MTFPESDLNGQAGFLLDEGDRPEITRDSIWRTQTGVRVRIADMADSHLLNTIRVLRGKSPRGTTFRTDDVRRRDWINAMANEAYSRGLALDDLDDNDPIHE